MDNKAHPLDNYFDSARREPGISESEVRAIVERTVAGTPRARATWPWMAASVGAVAIVIGAVVLTNDSDRASESRDKNTSASSAAAVAPTHSRDLKQDIVAQDVQPATNDRIDSSNNHTSTLSEGTMNRTTITRGLAGAALAIGMTATATAQKTPTSKPERKTVKIEMQHELSPAMEKMADELGRSAANYWVARLNAYKTRIDRTLAPDDLVKLNKMRVRFGVMLADHGDVTTNAKNGLHSEEEEVIIEREIEIGTDDNAGGKERREVNIRINGAKNGMEIFAMHQGAKEIAQRYREAFDALGVDVLTDFVGFLKEMHTAGKVFMSSHRAEMEQEIDGKKIEMKLKQADDVIASFESEEHRAMMQMAYSLIAEPIIMLYDGGDLRQIFGQAGPLSSAVTGMNLPETNALKQNVPNPAGSSTTISYALDTPSNATLLRLFNSTGELVGSYDQGAREAGDHAATVDLSKLPNGVYLYHLTVQSPDGERVYSKAMQVAR